MTNTELFFGLNHSKEKNPYDKRDLRKDESVQFIRNLIWKKELRIISFKLYDPTELYAVL